MTNAQNIEQLSFKQNKHLAETDWAKTEYKMTAEREQWYQVREDKIAVQNSHHIILKELELS